MTQTIQIKRTVGSTAPATLGEGELAVGMTDTPPLLWVGTPGGVKQVNGNIIIAIDPPANPTHGMLWWENDTGALFTYYNDGTSAQWVQIK